MADLPDETEVCSRCGQTPDDPRPCPHDGSCSLARAIRTREAAASGLIVGMDALAALAVIGNVTEGDFLRIASSHYRDQFTYFNRNPDA